MVQGAGCRVQGVGYGLRHLARTSAGRTLSGGSPPVLPSGALRGERETTGYEREDIRLETTGYKVTSLKTTS